MRQKLIFELLQTALEIQAQGKYHVFMWYTGSCSSLEITVTNDPYSILQPVLKIDICGKFQPDANYLTSLYDLKALRQDYKELPSDELITA